MKGGYIEDYEMIQGCWRCGEIMGDIRQEEQGYICESCGEQAIVSMINILDVMNDLHLRGLLMQHGEEILIDDIEDEV